MDKKTKVEKEKFDRAKRCHEKILKVLSEDNCELSPFVVINKDGNQAGVDVIAK